jgi:uncharacterized glyoxalase superfamily protein PhnB
MPGSQLDAGPVFIGVHLDVQDMAAAVEFYRRIGLSIPDSDLDMGHVEIDVGSGTHIGLNTPEVMRAYNPDWRPANRPPGNILQFRLGSREAVDELYSELTAAGYTGHLAPIDAFWGNRYAEMNDPDGNIVGFHSPTDPSMTAPFMPEAGRP